jgi:hypothetical protein
MRHRERDELLKSARRKHTLKTPRERQRWLCDIICGVHLGLVTPAKAQTILEIIEIAVFGGKLGWNGLRRKQWLDRVLQQEGCTARTFGRVTRGEREHVLCNGCWTCECGCGKTPREFQDERERRRREVEFNNWDIAACGVVTDDHKRRLKEHFMNCKTGRWEEGGCNHSVRVENGDLLLRNYKEVIRIDCGSNNIR